MAILELEGAAEFPISDERLLLLLRGGWVLTEEPDVRDPSHRDAMTLGAIIGAELDGIANDEPASDRGLP
jgi:hypothetical protein